MQPPKELNPSDACFYSEEMLTFDRNRQTLYAPGENAAVNLQDRVAELEARNLYLQSLVVELLDKNEQLRRKAQEKPPVDFSLSSNPRS